MNPPTQPSINQTINTCPVITLVTGSQSLFAIFASLLHLKVSVLPSVILPSVHPSIDSSTHLPIYQRINQQLSNVNTGYWLSVTFRYICQFTTSEGICPSLSPSFPLSIRPWIHPPTHQSINQQQSDVNTGYWFSVTFHYICQFTISEYVRFFCFITLSTSLST
jgi:hypothetical protein